MKKQGVYRGFSTVGRDDWETRLSDRDLVVRDLLNALSTVRGERPMLPLFGTSITARLFDAWTASDLAAVDREIRDVVAADPRIRLEKLVVEIEENAVVASLRVSYVELDLSELIRVRFDDTGLRTLSAEQLAVST